MLRKKLEPKIDHVLTNILSKEDFLGRIVNEHNERAQSRAPEVDRAALTAKVHALRQKRQRVLDAFFDGMISKQDRNQRVEDVEKEILVYERLLLQSADEPKRPGGLDLDAVLAVVEPFAEWPFLTRDDKRRLLGSLCPDIRVCRYEIKDLQLNLGAQEGGGYEDSHLKTAW